MKKLFVLIIISFFVIQCGPSDSSTSGGKKKIIGSQLFQTYCVTCHGIDGNLGLNGAIRLPESQLTLEERIEVVTKGRKVMPSFKGLMSKKEIEAVAKYTLKLKQ